MFGYLGIINAHNSIATRSWLDVITHTETETEAETETETETQ